MKETTTQIKTHLMANSNLSRKEIMIGNFLGGVMWGVGSALGATLVLGILVTSLKSINFIPILGNFASDIVNTVQSKQLEKNK